MPVWALGKIVGPASMQNICLCTRASFVRETQAKKKNWTKHTPIQLARTLTTVLNISLLHLGGGGITRAKCPMATIKGFFFKMLMIKEKEEVLT